MGNSRSKEAMKTILLVEDEDLALENMSKILSHSGFQVLEAEDGKKACELYLENKDLITAVVSDLIMPNMNGVELAQFNYKHRYFPFVVCTAISDANIALALLNIGVQDYVVKPIKMAHFVGVVKHAIFRRLMDLHMEDDANPFAGNLGSMIIRSRMIELHRVTNWIKRKMEDLAIPREVNRYISLIFEFLLNAHEHGNLRIKEKEKAELILNDKYNEEIKLREERCEAKIKVELSVLEDEVAISITDDGYGFKYDRYFKMPESELMERLQKPNGRGILMGTNFFDSVKYTKGGASVLLTKKIQR